MTERVAIVGTAQSWKRTPWTDTGLHVRSLNDAYRMKGFVRADSWYDFHPLDKFYYPDTEAIYAHQVPPGHYVRPVGHLQWMADQVMPLWLHPEYVTQHPAAANWPHARAFPKADIEEYFGRYFTSSPGWMIAHALMEGVKELHIYGIHLATEHEYIEQRPNFEYLCGALLGRGKRTITTADGMRRYETSDGILVLPEAAPVLQSDFQYAFDARPRQALEPLRWEAHKYQVKRERAINQLRVAPWWQLTGGIKKELLRVEAVSADIQDQIARQEHAGRLG